MPDIAARKPWHRHPLAGWLLRAVGLLLLLSAWRAGVALVQRGHAAHADAVEYALALIAFLGTSAGAVSTLLGAHLFDQVPIAARWGQVRSTDADMSATPSIPRSVGSRRPDHSRSTTA